MRVSAPTSSSQSSQLLLLLLLFARLVLEDRFLGLIRSPPPPLPIMQGTSLIPLPVSDSSPLPPPPPPPPSPPSPALSALPSSRRFGSTAAPERSSRLTRSGAKGDKLRVKKEKTKPVVPSLPARP